MNEYPYNEDGWNKSNQSLPFKLKVGEKGNIFVKTTKFNFFRGLKYFMFGATIAFAWYLK